jgi:hypothetical protein
MSVERRFRFGGMRMILLFSFLSIHLSGFCQQNYPLPKSIAEEFQKLNLHSEYFISTYIQPYYLESDFNGDSLIDAAVAVEQKETQKKGIIIIHRSTGKYFVFGAGTKFGNGGDNYDWMDVWNLYTAPELEELTFGKEHDIDGSRKIILKNAGFRSY